VVITIFVLTLIFHFIGIIFVLFTKIFKLYFVAILFKRNVCRILVEKPEGKRPLGRPRYRWVNNIKMDLREIGWGGMDWIDLTQDREQWRALVNMVMNLLVP
jgi:hypothetical protein